MSSIKSSQIPLKNFIDVEIIKKSFNSYEPFIISKTCLMGFISFYLKIHFSKLNSFPILKFLKCQRAGLFYQGVLLELKVAVIRDSEVHQEWKHLFKRILMSDPSWELDEIKLPLSHNSLINTLNLRLTFEFMYPFNLDSCLVVSFSYPSKAPLFRYFNKKDTSDICFQLKTTKQEIWVRKDIITFECPFFEKMLLGEWSKNLEDKINAPWSDKVFLSCVLHLYTGWLPGSPICKAVFEKLNLNKCDLELKLEDAVELYEVAKMLELYALAHFSLKQLHTLAEQQQASLMNGLLNVSLTTEKQSL